MAFPDTIIMVWITVGPELIHIDVHLQPYVTDELMNSFSNNKKK